MYAITPPPSLPRNDRTQADRGRSEGLNIKGRAWSRSFAIRVHLARSGKSEALWTHGITMSWDRTHVSGLDYDPDPYDNPFALPLPSGLLAQMVDRLQETFSVMIFYGSPTSLTIPGPLPCAEPPAVHRRLNIPESDIRRSLKAARDRGMIQ